MRREPHRVGAYIRASAAIAGDSHVIIVGSQAILGQYPEASAELLVSMKADVYPKGYSGDLAGADKAVPSTVQAFR